MIQDEEATKVKKISFYMKKKGGKIMVVSQPNMEDFSW